MHFKEVTFEGKPGNIIIVMRRGSGVYNGLPVRGICWGPLDADGRYRCLIDADVSPEIQSHEMDPSPELIRHLEENWHLNTTS